MMALVKMEPQCLAPLADPSHEKDLRSRSATGMVTFGTLVNRG